MTSSALSIPISSSESMAAMSAPKKLLLLLCNAIPLLQVICIGSLIWILHQSPWLCLAVVLLFLYLVPPLLCRTIMGLFPIHRQTIPLGSRDFFVWWFTLNLQMIFCRFPALEECLRVIPSCYSAWLRLWGAKIGKLTYWGAGLAVLDRQFLRVGDHVTFGASVRVNPHVILPNAEGQLVLLLAPVQIGDRVSIGGYSLLVAGTEITANQCTRAFLILPPFNRLEGGRRCKPENAELLVGD